jgi:hypothetical protein
MRDRFCQTATIVACTHRTNQTVRMWLNCERSETYHRNGEMSNTRVIPQNYIFTIDMSDELVIEGRQQLFLGRSAVVVGPDMSLEGAGGSHETENDTRNLRCCSWSDRTERTVVG